MGLGGIAGKGGGGKPSGSSSGSGGGFASSLDKPAGSLSATSAQTGQVFGGGSVAQNVEARKSEGGVFGGEGFRAGEVDSGVTRSSALVQAEAEKAKAEAQARGEVLPPPNIFGVSNKQELSSFEASKRRRQEAITQEAEVALSTKVSTGLGIPTVLQSELSEVVPSKKVKLPIGSVPFDVAFGSPKRFGEYVKSSGVKGKVEGTYSIGDTVFVLNKNDTVIKTFRKSGGETPFGIVGGKPVVLERGGAPLSEAEFAQAKGLSDFGLASEGIVKREVTKEEYARLVGVAGVEREKGDRVARSELVKRQFKGISDAGVDYTKELSAGAKTQGVLFQKLERAGLAPIPEDKGVRTYDFGSPVAGVEASRVDVAKAQEREALTREIVFLGATGRGDYASAIFAKGGGELSSFDRKGASVLVPAFEAIGRGGEFLKVQGDKGYDFGAGLKGAYADFGVKPAGVSLRQAVGLGSGFLVGTGRLFEAFGRRPATTIAVGGAFYLGGEIVSGIASPIVGAVGGKGAKVLLGKASKFVFGSPAGRIGSFALGSAGYRYATGDVFDTKGKPYSFGQVFVQEASVPALFEAGVPALVYGAPRVVRAVKTRAKALVYEPVTKGRAGDLSTERFTDLLNDQRRQQQVSGSTTTIYDVGVTPFGKLLRFKPQQDVIVSTPTTIRRIGGSADEGGRIGQAGLLSKEGGVGILEVKSTKARYKIVNGERVPIKDGIEFFDTEALLNYRLEPVRGRSGREGVGEGDFSAVINSLLDSGSTRVDVLGVTVRRGGKGKVVTESFFEGTGKVKQVVEESGSQLFAKDYMDFLQGVQEAQSKKAFEDVGLSVELKPSKPADVLGDGRISRAQNKRDVDLAFRGLYKGSLPASLRNVDAPRLRVEPVKVNLDVAVPKSPPKSIMQVESFVFTELGSRNVAKGDVYKGGLLGVGQRQFFQGQGFGFGVGEPRGRSFVDLSARLLSKSTVDKRTTERFAVVTDILFEGKKARGLGKKGSVYSPLKDLFLVEPELIVEEVPFFLEGLPKTKQLSSEEPLLSLGDGLVSESVRRAPKYAPLEAVSVSRFGVGVPVSRSPVGRLKNEFSLGSEFSLESVRSPVEVYLPATKQPVKTEFVLDSQSRLGLRQGLDVPFVPLSPLGGFGFGVPDIPVPPPPLRVRGGGGDLTDSGGGGKTGGGVRSKGYAPSVLGVTLQLKRSEFLGGNVGGVRGIGSIKGKKEKVKKGKNRRGFSLDFGI